MTVFALIHSPLVGSYSWQLVAEQFEHSSYQVIVPRLVDQNSSEKLLWEQHAESAAQFINETTTEPSILIGHSGAGPILPAIGERLREAPSGFIFVDAGLPKRGLSRLELMRAESAEWVASLEQHLLAGEWFPTWQDEDLKGIVPDDEVRQRLMAGVTPRPLNFFTEKITFTHKWQSTACGYVHFSDPYSVHAERAKVLGWPFITIKAGHFHMLVDATAVANAIVQISEQLKSEP